eukprot:Em0003g227a
MKSLYAENCKAVESLSRSTPAPQQPCPYQLTSGLKPQYTLPNVPTASPTHPDAHAVNDLCDKCDKMLVSLRHSLSDRQCKVINDHYDQHLTKAKAFHDTYNANIKEAEKEWRGMGQNFRDQILSCLESRAQLSLFSSHTYLDMQMQYSFNYCQQVSLPYSSQQWKKNARGGAVGVHQSGRWQCLPS